MQKTAVKKPCKRLWILPPNPLPKRIAVKNILLESYLESFKIKQKVDNKKNRYSRITIFINTVQVNDTKVPRLLTRLSPLYCYPRNANLERIRKKE